MIFSKTNARLTGWLLVVGSASALTFALIPVVISSWAPGSSLSYERLVTIITSLAVGLHSAFLLSPSDEPALEILLVSPRPLPRILLERLVMLAVLQGSIASIASLISLTMADRKDLLLIIANWLAPSVCLSGVALSITQLTRQSALSSLLTLMLWGGMIIGGDEMIIRWPALWPFHLFLRPDKVALPTYLLNRAILVLIGLALTAGATRLMRNEEYMLLGTRSASQNRR